VTRFVSGQKLANTGLKVSGVFNPPGAERDVDDGVSRFPVPVVFQKETPEEFLSGEEGLAQGIEEEALSEAAGAREEKYLPSSKSFLTKGGLST